MELELVTSARSSTATELAAAYSDAKAKSENLAHLSDQLSALETQSRDVQAKLEEQLVSGLQTSCQKNAAGSEAFQASHTRFSLRLEATIADCSGLPGASKEEGRQGTRRFDAGIKSQIWQNLPSSEYRRERVRGFDF